MMKYMRDWRTFSIVDRALNRNTVRWSTNSLTSPSISLSCDGCVVLLFYVHGKHLRSCRDGQLT